MTKFCVFKREKNIIIFWENCVFFNKCNVDESMYNFTVEHSSGLEYYCYKRRL